MSDLEQTLANRPDLGLTGLAIHSRNYSSLAALIFLVVEHIWTIKGEYRYIWRARSVLVKTLYLSARYITLIMLIVHYTLVHTILLPAYSSSTSISTTQCQAWFIFLQGGCTVITALLDVVLFLRVYAMYMKHRATYILILPIAIQIAVTGVFLHSSVLDYVGEDGSVHGVFNSICDMKEIPRATPYLAGSYLLTNIALFLASVSGRRKVAQSVEGCEVKERVTIHGQRERPATRIGRGIEDPERDQTISKMPVIITLVVRQGGWACAVMGAFVASMVPYTFKSRSVNPFVLFIWPTVMLSVLTCRLIMNLRTLDLESHRSPSPFRVATRDIRLSTVVFEVEATSKEVADPESYWGRGPASHHGERSNGEVGSAPVTESGDGNVESGAVNCTSNDDICETQR